MNYDYFEARIKTAYEVRPVSFIAMYNLLHKQGKTGMYDVAWAHKILDQGSSLIRWLYLNKDGVLVGFDWSNITTASNNRKHDVVDLTSLPAIPNKTVVIDGKTVILSPESFEALKQSLLED